MQRIGTNDGKYHNADPLNGVAGTVVQADALNAIQEEIISVITAAGITLDPNSQGQLLDAILGVTGNGQIAWGAVTGKPATYPPETHTQGMGTITGLGDALAGLMPKTWELAAGDGLVGGGTGSADRMVSLGVPSVVTGATANSASGTTHTHALDIGKSDVGLGSVDNTSDLDKPISTAQQAALDACVHLADAETITGLKTISPYYATFPVDHPEFHSLIVGTRLAGPTRSSILLASRNSANRGASLEYDETSGQFQVRGWNTAGANPNELFTVNVVTGLARFSGVVNAPTYQSSDPRLKHNLRRVTLDRAAIDRASLWAWDWGPESARSGRGEGVRADEVRRIMPAAVCSDDDGYDMVDYGQLGVGLGMDAHARIAWLESRVADLEKN